MEISKRFYRACTGLHLVRLHFYVLRPSGAGGQDHYILSDVPIYIYSGEYFHRKGVFFAMKVDTNHYLPLDFTGGAYIISIFLHIYPPLINGDFIEFL